MSGGGEDRRLWPPVASCFCSHDGSRLYFCFRVGQRGPGGLFPRRPAGSR